MGRGREGWGDGGGGVGLVASVADMSCRQITDVITFCSKDLNNTNPEKSAYSAQYLIFSSLSQFEREIQQYVEILHSNFVLG